MQIKIYSELMSIHTDVSQGSILGPVVLLINVNDIANVYHLFYSGPK